MIMAHASVKVMMNSGSSQHNQLRAFASGSHCRRGHASCHDAASECSAQIGTHTAAAAAGTSSTMVCCVAVSEHAAAHHAYAHTTCTARRSRKNARTQCIFKYTRVLEKVLNDMQPRDEPNRPKMASTLVQGISDGLRNQKQDRGRRNGFLHQQVYGQGYNVGQALREEVEEQLHAATVRYTDRMNKIIRETRMHFNKMHQLEHDLRTRLKHISELETYLKNEVQQVHEAMRKSVKKGEEVTVVIKESAGQARLRV